MDYSNRDEPDKTHADLVDCLRRIHPKDRMRAFTAALLEVETREKAQSQAAARSLSAARRGPRKPSR